MLRLGISETRGGDKSDLDLVQALHGRAVAYSGSLEQLQGAAGVGGAGGVFQTLLSGSTLEYIRFTLQRAK